jgi:hypothetical protein
LVLVEGVVQDILYQLHKVQVQALVEVEVQLLNYLFHRFFYLMNFM